METKDIAKELGRRFLQRRTVKAIQRQDGSYNPVHEPWKLQDLIDHIEGRATWGHYLIDEENNCRVAAFDIDLRAQGQWRLSFDDEWLDIEPRMIWLKRRPNEIKEDLTMQLRCMAEGLALRAHRLTSLDVAIAYSGCKGMHVYILFPTPVQAKIARETAENVLVDYKCFELVRGNHLWRHIDGYRSLDIEVFPKQDNVRDGGLGNLMRLPLGKHRKSGEESFFVNLSTGYNRLSADDPAQALAHGSIRGLRWMK